MVRDAPFEPLWAGRKTVPIMVHSDPFDGIEESPDEDADAELSPPEGPGLSPLSLAASVCIAMIPMVLWIFVGFEQAIISGFTLLLIYAGEAVM